MLGLDPGYLLPAAAGIRRSDIYARLITVGKLSNVGHKCPTYLLRFQP